MTWYRCYIHSVGGGVYCEGPLEFKNKFGAEEYAYDMAIDDYESFKGYHGIPDIGDIFDSWEDYGFEEYPFYDDAWECYQEERENWLDYWVKEAKDENDIDEDYQ